MYITQVNLKNFRCFENLNLGFNKQVILIDGLNGTGKTSLLEALHYACYLRSFRTHSPQELAKDGDATFFVKVGVAQQNMPPEANHEIQIGFSGKRRVVKVDQKQIVSYKELLHYYRIITLTEDDLALIKEGPELRRAFIDQVIMIFDPDHIHLLKKLRHTVDNRNALLKKGTYSKDSLDFWTEQLWDVSQQVRHLRKDALREIQDEVSHLIEQSMPEVSAIEFIYQPKKDHAGDFAGFQERYPTLAQDEAFMKRSLFGAHLDDFLIEFRHQKSRVFASRGQQKLILLLIKIAQIQLLIKKTGQAPIFLLDDFMTDFDQKRGALLISLLKLLNCQLIFTAPAPVAWLHESLDLADIQHVNISI